MNNKGLYAVIAVIVVAVIAWLALFSKPGMSGTPTANLSGASAPAGTSGGTQSLKGLLAAGTSQTCTFSNAGTTGQVYVAGGQMRGDFTSANGSGAEVQSHMITDGTTAYVWTSAMAQGIKMSFANLGGSGSSGATSGGVDPNQQVSYSCTPWSGDQSEFAMPAGVTFQDMSAMMGGGTPTAPSGATVPKGSTGPDYTPPATGGTSANSMMCAQCNLVPDANGKAQCRALYNCK